MRWRWCARQFALSSFDKRASCAPVDRSIRVPKQAVVTKGLAFFRRRKNFCSTEFSDAWMKQAAECLQFIWRAAGVRGDKLRMKSSADKRTVTRGPSNMIPADPRGMQPQLHQTKDTAHLSGPPAGIVGSSIATPRWLHTRNSLLSELPG